MALKGQFIDVDQQYVTPALNSILRYINSGLAAALLAGAADAVPPHAPATYLITKAGVDAMTLAAPTAGGEGVGDDGTIIRLISTTANAHTLTTVALLMSGGANTNVATFAAHPGASLTLMAYNGLWYVLGANAVTFTS